MQVFHDLTVDQATAVTEFADRVRYLNWMRVPLRQPSDRT
jgi:hypothetical protein